MDQFAGPKIRNVVLLAHSGAGKTSLAEAMLFATKGISRLGSVGDGNTVSDFDPEEHRRETSLQLAVIPCVWKGTKVNLLDTPGYADFIGETVSALRAADAAVVVVSAPSGVEVGTELVWARVREAGLPVLVFINKMDREHADHAAALAQVREKLGNRCAAVNLPIGAEASFSGVVDLLDGDVPAEAQAGADAARDQLAEAVAETDDDLTMKFLEEERLSAEEIATGLRAGVRTGAVVPVLTGSSTTGVGIEALLDAIVDYLPAPTDVPPVKAEKGGAEVELTADPAGPLAAFVFKTSADPFVGKLSYLRVFSGTLASNSEAWDSKSSEAERVSQVFVSIGKHQENVSKLVAGDIGSVAKLVHAVTGSTLTTKDAAIALPPVDFPPAVYNVAVHPKSKADHDKLSSSLARLVEEDPSLRLSRDRETSETIVSGLGGPPGRASRTAGPSPSSRMMAMGAFTATPSVPSGTRMRPNTPSSTASISMVALSVSISTRMSPALTLSPSLACHFARLPSVMVGDRAGMRISMVMSCCIPSGNRRSWPPPRCGRSAAGRASRDLRHRAWAHRPRRPA